MSGDPFDSPARRALRRHLVPDGNVLPPDVEPSPVARSEPTGVEGGERRRREGSPGPSRWTRWLRASTSDGLWWVRAPLLPLLAWVAWRHAGDIWWGSLFAGINLAFHEVGHVLFGFTGNEFLTIAGGTVLELLIPVVAAVLLARQRDAFGVGVAVFWWGTAFASVGRYIYDTRSQIFERVSLGPVLGPDDWTYLLSRWGLVRQDRVIGMAVKEVGVALMVAALAWCVWVLWLMAKADRARGAGTTNGATRS